MRPLEMTVRMKNDNPLRSPELMHRDSTLLLVIDVQTRLLSAQPNAEAIVENTRRVLDAASVLGVKTLGTEQVPEKLGPTVDVLAERLPNPIASKSEFSAMACDEVGSTIQEHGIRHVLLAGIETHVCVQQTAMDLIAAGLQPVVAADAVGSRFEEDHQIALRRMEAAGVVLTTTEAAMFEWCERASDEAFREISKLAKER